MKKFLSALLSVAVATSVLTACAGGAANGSGGPDASAGSAKPTEPVKLVALYAPPNNYTPTDPNVLEEVRQKMIADIGVDLQVIVGPTDGQEYQTKFNLMLAGGDHLDIAQVHNWRTLHAQGAIADITDPLAQYGPDIMKRWGEENMKIVEKDGRIWGIPRNCSFVGYPIFVRQDWLDQYGLSAPKTIEDLELVMKTFKEKDPAGNGKTVPLLAAKESRYSLAGAFIEGGWGEYIDPADNRVKPPFMDPGYRDFVAKLAEWYQNGYLPKDVFVMNSGQQVDTIKSGRLGVSALWYSRITLNEGELQKTFPKASYALCSIEGPKGKAETVNSVYKLPQPGSGSGEDAMVVMSKCQNVDAAIKAYNWGYIDDNYLFSRYGKNGYKLISKDGDRMIFSVIKDQTGDEYNGFYKGPANEGIFVPEVSNINRHLEYLTTPSIFYDFDRAKMPMDAEIQYDSKALDAAAPTYPDIMRVVDEWFVEFVTGGRAISDFDAFYAELDKVKVDQLIDEITRQYNELK